MARDSRSRFLQELARVSPSIEQAFLLAMQDIRSAAQSRAIEAAIERALQSGDIVRGAREVAAAITLGPEFFAPLDRQISEAFYAGGVWQVSTLPKSPSTGSAGPFIVRFNGSSQRVQEWTRTRAGDLITEIVDDQREMIRETIDEALREQRGYRAVTQALVGKTVGNERQGGLIGLHSNQARAVRAARVDLEQLDSRYFRRARRDRRFDGTVAKAIREGKPLSNADIDKITGRYAERLLRLRAETIARTEGNKAMNAGRSEAIVQMVESGKIPPEAVSVVWKSTPDIRTRESHVALNGVQVPWGGFFVSPVTGALMRWPHDENAPAAETVNCRCSAEFKIDWLSLAE